MIENGHLWHAGRGTYYDRNINIISQSDSFHVYLGKYNSIGQDCTFFLHTDHRKDWVTTSPLLLDTITKEIKEALLEMGHPTSNGAIFIENDVCIGPLSTIMSGVRIGNGSIVLPTSTIIEDTPPYSIVGGNPGNIVGYRFSEKQISSLLKFAWWDWPEDMIKDEYLLLWSNNIDEFIERHL